MQDRNTTKRRTIICMIALSSTQDDTIVGRKFVHGSSTDESPWTEVRGRKLDRRKSMDESLTNGRKST